MYPRYNIPQQSQSMQTRRNNYPNRPGRPNDDRFIGGGFLGPFLLGGIAGSIVSRPNYGYGPILPPPVIYYPPVPRPYYSNNNYYYY